MNRSAARHSKAASEAYLRGDHLSAQHFSLKAQEEWDAANRLNAQAAKEILTACNGKNDQWTLDLHGLHAKEAVQALQEHLQKIESQVAQNKRSFGAAVSFDVENESKGSHLLNKQRPAFLEVITGIFLLKSVAQGYDTSYKSRCIHQQHVLHYGCSNKLECVWTCYYFMNLHHSLYFLSSRHSVTIFWKCRSVVRIMCFSKIFCF